MAQESQSLLTPEQKRILDVIAAERYFTDRFYFAGGTALAEFYLKHRISEDLDFFSEREEVDPVAIARFFERGRSQLEITTFDTRRVFGLHSFFFHFHDGRILKVDFNYYPFPRIERGVRYGNLDVESVYDIGVNKVHTIALKPRARDFIDLYFIVREKGYAVNELLMQAKAKFDWDIPPLELGARLMEAKDLTDYPRMVKPIDHRAWKQFFVAEARKLKKDIFKS